MDLHWLMLLAGTLLGVILRGIVTPYLAAKGQNLATQEDIEGITDQIEAVKHEYALQMEVMRAQLSGQLATHGFRYQREFSILEELAKNLVSVRDLALALRPVIDHLDSSKSADEIKQERLAALWAAGRDLYMASEQARPFYPQNIYEAINALSKMANRERVIYQWITQDTHPKGVTGYWDEALENSGQLAALADAAILEIRTRVEKWDPVRAGSIASER